MATNDSFCRETSVSIRASLLPHRTETASGTSDSSRAKPVSRGL